MLRYIITSTQIGELESNVDMQLFISKFWFAKCKRVLNDIYAERNI